jgi:AcrR family transcriptional regulator
MARQYDSSRRKAAAEQTRQEILRAALKLHWEGITELEPLAREVGCSLPTVRKHFPTKEALYRGCTRTFAETLAMPDLAALRAIADPKRRLEVSVRELCRIHEAMFGYAWLAAYQRRESRTLDAEMSAYEGLADAIAGILVPPDSPNRPVVRGLLDFLTYRALRLSGGLSPEQARKKLIVILRPLISAGK